MRHIFSRKLISKTRIANFLVHWSLQLTVVIWMQQITIVQLIRHPHISLLLSNISTVIIPNTPSFNKCLVENSIRMFNLYSQRLNNLYTTLIKYIVWHYCITSLTDLLVSHDSKRIKCCSVAKKWFFACRLVRFESQWHPTYMFANNENEISRASDDYTS